jgi:hypothetical protein
MGRTQNAGTRLLRSQGLTMIICGLATLALAAVLICSGASGAAGGADDSVTIVTRPPAAGTVVADADPFATGAVATAAAER